MTKRLAWSLRSYSTISTHCLDTQFYKEHGECTKHEDYARVATDDKTKDAYIGSIVSESPEVANHDDNLPDMQTSNSLTYVQEETEFHSSLYSAPLFPNGIMM